MGIRAKIWAIGAVGIIGMLVLGGTAAWAVNHQQSLAAQMIRLQLLDRMVQDVRYANADVSGWQAFYAWDTRRMDPAEAVAGAPDSNRAWFEKSVAELEQTFAEFPLDQLTPEERAHWDEILAGWDVFFAADAKAVEGYRTGTPASMDQADALIDDTELEGSAAWAYDRIDSAAIAIADSVRAREADAQARIDAVATTVLWLVSIVVLVAAVVLAITAHKVSGRILDNARSVLESIRALGRGDLTVPSRANSTDELGRMALAAEEARLSMRDVISQVAGASDSVSDASTRLAEVSAQLGDTSRAVTAGMRDAAAATATVSDEVQTVAAGTEEMSASIREIATNAESAAQVAARAVLAAELTTSTIAKLGDSSAQIGSVIQSIGQIAGQTNQLALNATIESARAGEAGKGFAVVAGEVKDLARETSTATEDISRRITDIQDETAAAIAAIDQIGAIVRQINDTQASIASSVDQQTATTNEMGSNVHHAASETAAISRSLRGLVDRAGESSESARLAADAARELTDEAGALHRLVRRFTID